MKIIKTPIEGLKIKLNKVIGDRRGYLYELAPGGKDNEFLRDGIGNIYCSTATQRGIPRGGHYHEKLVENFFTISGLALWLFKDFRKKSSTFGKAWGVILGEEEKINLPASFPAYLLPYVMAQVWVPAGVYHVYYPLTSSKVIVLAVTSLPHDDSDYVRLLPDQDKDLKRLLEKVNFDK